MPTIAAIHGACVGGGCELALACQYRIATSARATKIGLPEVMLGIIPAWGGCTRLPRLVGIPKALDVILAGKTVAAERALKMGMIDEVVQQEQLMTIARERLLRPVQAAPQHSSRLQQPCFRDAHSRSWPANFGQQNPGKLSSSLRSSRRRNPWHLHAVWKNPSNASARPSSVSRKVT